MPRFERRVGGVFSLAILVGLVGAVPGSAQQGTVTVRVTTVAGPLEGAQVAIGPRGALTDASGETTLTVEPGSHALVVSRVGYASYERTVEVADGDSMTVVVELVEEAIETEEVVVVLSSRAERRIEDEPLRVEVVEREEIEEKLLMTPGDIGMLLNETAGLRVQPTAPSLGGASVRIQGLRGRYTQILSDGLPLYGGQTGALGPLQIPPMDLGQVEVIKGAASALYGATALGGVVNLISRRPSAEREVLLNQSSLGGTDAVLWLSDEIDDRWGYTFLASGHRQSMSDVDTDGWADLPGFGRLAARPRLFWDNGEGGSVFATVGVMAEDREGGTLPGETTPGGSPVGENLETRRIDAGIVGRWLLGDTRRLSVRGSGSLQGHRHEFDTVLERDSHETAFAEISFAGEDGRHLWVVGAAIQREAYRADDFPVFDFTHSIPALFAQDDFAPTRWLTLSGSLRYDQHSDYGAFLSPRVSALVRPGDWVIRSSAGAGFFAPSPFTEETESVGLNRLVPFGTLRAERVVGGMVDLGRQIGGWEINATLFASRVEDPLVVRPNGAGAWILENTTEPVRTSGTELLARYHRGPIHLTATYVHTRSTEADPGGAGRREVPLTPDHTLGTVAAYESEGRGRVGVELYYTGRQSLEDNPYRSESEPYWILGLLVERRFGPARLFLNLENMLDARQTAHDRLVLPSRGMQGEWITDVWAPLEGRAINGGVRIAL